MEITRWQALGRCTAIFGCIAAASFPLSPLAAHDSYAAISVQTIITPSCMISGETARTSFHDRLGALDIVTPGSHEGTSDRAIFVLSCWGADRPAITVRRTVEAEASVMPETGGPRQAKPAAQARLPLKAAEDTLQDDPYRYAIVVKTLPGLNILVGPIQVSIAW